MRLDKTLLKQITEDADVLPGNVYPAMGGKKTPGTDFWLVIAVSNTGAHCIGFNADGEPVSTTTYLKSAMRSRPVIARVDLTYLILA
jgi:hypothetical protein